jgi:tetratricopeptide (TPR) repeat protein
MKKRYILLIILIIIACPVLLWWFWPGPSTELIDATGQELTAGEPVDDGENSEYDGFDAVEAMIEAKEFDSAKTRLLKLIETSEMDGRACVLLCDVTRELNDVEASVDYGLKAVTLLPESAAAHLAYAKALGMQLASNRRSVSDFLGAMKGMNLLKEEINRVLELDPDEVEAWMMLMFMNLAPWPIGDIDRAIEICAEIESRDPILGKRFLAFCLHRKEETARAIEICLAGIETYPEELGFHATLADIYADEKRFKEADTEYEAARQGERDETYFRSLYYQALMHINNKLEPARAVEWLDTFIEGEPRGEGPPSVAYACLRKGNALEQLDRKQEARAAYEECLRNEPGFDLAEEALAGLEE